MLEELPTEHLTAIQLPIYTHSALRISPGDVNRGTARRFVYQNGISQLAKLLAKDLDVRLQVHVDTLEKSGDRFVIGAEEFDGVVLTPPIPQTTTLLWQLDENRPTANVTYRSCISVLLGYDKPLDPRYHALIDVEQRHPLAWLSVESAKTSGRAPEGHTALVLQFSSAFSFEHYSADDAWIIGTAVSFVTRLYGPDWYLPVEKDVKRWKYSQPEGFSAIETVNRPGDRLILAGDGFMGPRIEEAYESGVLAAQLMIKALGGG